MESNGTPEAKSPKDMVNFSDPVIRLVREIVEDIEAEPWYQAWMLDIWLTSQSKRRKGSLTWDRYDAHYRSLFEVAARVYAKALTMKDPPPVPRRQADNPLTKLYRETHNHCVVTREGFQWAN